MQDTSLLPTASSATIRDELVETLRLDLVGPDNNHAFAHELLPEAPNFWYLTGFLAPASAPIAQRTDETANDDLDTSAEAGGLDDNTQPEKPAARKSLLPSSMGLSVLVASGVDQLTAEVGWGDYIYEGGDEPTESAHTQPAPTQTGATSEPASPADTTANTALAKVRTGYRRAPHDAQVVIPLHKKRAEIEVPGGGGLWLIVTTRAVSNTTIGAGQLPAGTRSVSVFVVNKRVPDKEHGYRAFAFQVKLKLASPLPFVPRPDLRGSADHSAFDTDWDERVGDLQYRDAFEIAVGHGVSATWANTPAGRYAAETAWLPQAEVERVAPSAIPDVELGMEVLGALADGAQAAAKLMPLVTYYRAWLLEQAKTTGLTAKQADTVREMNIAAQFAAKRIEAGIQLLSDPQVLDAFRLANRAMARAARQRNSIANKKIAEQQAAPAWRPFQLAYMLMALRSIVQPEHADREIVDLLFFPTGGGKTEAYLGLAAFTLVLRRFRHAGRTSGGLSVLMRYTLRLLTLDQLGRATALICALELEREQDVARLGHWPFEIGLWVGQAATPNRLGKKGDKGPGVAYTAYTKTMHFRMDSARHPAPIPLEECPWCGAKFDRNSFRLVPHDANPTDLQVHCANHTCEFSGAQDRHLPIVAVDEPIYRRLPAFLIATVDKFAALPWTGETGALFGHVERFDDDGYYGPVHPNKGTLLGGALPPPDLIIQDELHLISGPLGTIAGMYEAVVDKLSSRERNGRVIRPKIIASTATVRRADTQIRALFDRQQVTVFPAPGPNRRDSFFAHTEASNETPARLYLGIAASGRSLKVVLLRTALALLSAAQVAYQREGGDKNTANPADPYMTFLGYFNSLRELGGSRRIMEDEVNSRLRQFDRRRRIEPEDHLFTPRVIDYDLLELTSRVSTNQVAEAKQRLSLRFHEKDHVDAALATNMISVGLDIVRLGLMVVLGQPKTSAEYIQATSRVGRDPHRPGLVVTLLNVHKPRDRSHYERFGMYHASFYRAVEATSVTPFSPRALDRSLPAVLVALARLTRETMTAPRGAGQILALRHTLDDLSRYLADRARTHAWPPSPEASDALHSNVMHRCADLLDSWLNIAQKFQDTNTALQYQQETPDAQRLLYEFLHPDLPTLLPARQKFRANRSMRDVEPSVDIFIKKLNEWGDSR